MKYEKITKALELCSSGESEVCNLCPISEHFEDCCEILKREALNTINRQKDEIETLKSRIFALNDTNKMIMDSQECYWKNELKEYVCILKAKQEFLVGMDNKYKPYVSVEDIDNLLVEKVTE